MKRVLLVSGSDLGTTPPLSESFELMGLCSALTEHAGALHWCYRNAETLNALKQADRIVAVGGLGNGKWLNELISAAPDALGKTVLMGISVGEASLSDPGLSEILEQIARQGPIGVADLSTQDLLTARFGKNAAMVSGSPSLFLDIPKLEASEPLRLYAPADLDPVFNDKPQFYRRLVMRVGARLGKGHRLAFLAGSSKSLRLGAVPGAGTLIYPEFPALSLKAIASSQAVISGSFQTVLAAVQNGVPAILFGNESVDVRRAETCAIPHVAFHRNASSEEIAHRIEESLRKFPWTNVRERVSDLREKASAFFRARELGARRPRKSGAERSGVGTRHVAIVAEKTRLGAVVGLVENLIDKTGVDLHFHVLCETGDLSSSIRAVVGSRERGANAESLHKGLEAQTGGRGHHRHEVTFYSIEELWSQVEREGLRRITGHSAVSLSKPRFASHLLATRGQAIAFVDCENFFFDGIEHLFELLPQAATVLFPHLWDRYVMGAECPLYSSALFLVRPGSEAFLHWWSACCTQPGLTSRTGSSFHDELPLELAPILFPELGIYRELEHHVHSGNVLSAGVRNRRVAGETPALAEDKALGSFYSGLPEPFALDELKIGWDQLAVLFGNLRLGGGKSFMLARILWQQRRHWAELNEYWTTLVRIQGKLIPLMTIPSRAESRFFVRGLGRFLVRFLMLFQPKRKKLQASVLAAVDPREEETLLRKAQMFRGNGTPSSWVAAAAR